MDTASMSRLTACVRHGHLVLDLPTSLPEGTEIELVALDEGDTLTDEGRERLHASLERAAADAAAGRTRPAADFIAELRRRR